MTNQLKDRSDTLAPSRAPEVFLVLDALMRPQPEPELLLPPLKTDIKPYIPLVEVRPAENIAEL